MRLLVSGTKKIFQSNLWIMTQNTIKNINNVDKVKFSSEQTEFLVSAQHRSNQITASKRGIVSIDMEKYLSLSSSQ